MSELEKEPKPAIPPDDLASKARFMRRFVARSKSSAPPPTLGEAGQRDLLRKVQELAPRYRTQLLQKA